MSVFFATPIHRGTKADAQAAAQWGATVTGTLGLVGSSVGLINNCPWLDCARADLVMNFLKSSCQYLFFRDDDNWIEPAGVQAMLDLSKAWPIVIAPYVGGMPPHDWTHQIDTRGGIISAGLGLTLIKRYVIEEMIKAHPELTYDQDGVETYGLFIHEIVDGKLLKEDHAFFRRARMLGYYPGAVEGVTTWHGAISATWPGPPLIKAT